MIKREMKWTIGEEDAPDCLELMLDFDEEESGIPLFVLVDRDAPEGSWPVFCVDTAEALVEALKEGIGEANRRRIEELKRECRMEVLDEG